MKSNVGIDRKRNMAAEWRQPKHISMQFKIIFLLWGKNYIREVVSLNPSTSYWMDLFHITFLYCLIVKTGKKRIEAENGPFKNILDWLADKAVKGSALKATFMRISRTEEIFLSKKSDRKEENVKFHNKGEKKAHSD